MLDATWLWQLPHDDARLKSLTDGALVELVDADESTLVRLMRLGDRTVGSPWRVPGPGPYRVRSQRGTDPWSPPFEVIAVPVAAP